MSEREKQDVDLKPQKLKSLPKDLIVDKHIENLDIILSKTKNGYKLCEISKFDLLYSQRKRFGSHLKRFKKKYWI